jgi:hypothetical protein
MGDSSTSTMRHRGLVAAAKFEVRIEGWSRNFPIWRLLEIPILWSIFRPAFRASRASCQRHVTKGRPTSSLRVRRAATGPIKELNGVPAICPGRR